MRPSRSAPVLVIGVGNAYRGDDAAGLVAAGRIGAAASPGVEVIEHPGDPVSLMDVWAGRESVYLVDTVVAGGAPGAVLRFDALADPLPARFGRRGTHGAGVAEAIGLARVLGLLPSHLTIYGITGTSFTPGADLSPAVRRAVSEVCAQLRDELAQGTGLQGPMAGG